MTRTVKVIIDTDPGVDDALAILMALASPGVEVVGLTTVGGNVPLPRSTRNALALLEYTGYGQVPVARGAARPFRGRFRYSFGFHGRSGLTFRLPDPQIIPATNTAVEFLANGLQSQPGQITVVALGPLTNLAHLLDQLPEALRQSAGLVVMGGAVDVPGNVTPYAEFNFYSDPIAAQRVLTSGIPLTLVDLGAGRRTVITREDSARTQARSPLGRLAWQLLANWFRRDPKRQHFELYDPLAMAAAMNPGLLTLRRSSVSVEVEDQERLGVSQASTAPGPVAVVRQVDTEGFFALLEELFIPVGPGR